ncbi:MAG: hypothetical protein KF838_12230 [Phycisphaeraceae bacterium]|nr:MAG: hypothetical protein KF838_12230 [Phycisphaeraceae bacterium]
MAVLGFCLLQINTAILGVTGPWQNMKFGLAYVGTALALTASFLAFVVSAFLFARRLHHPIDGRPRLAWCIIIAVAFAAIGVPVQFLLGGWRGGGLWPQLNVYSWSIYAGHVLLILSLHTVLLLVATGIASCARDVLRERLTCAIACLFAFKCLGVVLSLAADAVDTTFHNGTGGSLATWAYSMEVPAAWVAWAWPWFDQLCMLLLGLAALLLARTLAGRFRNALAIADTTQMPHVHPET